MRQAGFSAALLNPEFPVPVGLVCPNGQPAQRRFAVYRNNVVVSLTEALNFAFPVVRKLVGDAYFAALAGEFLRRHPPQTRIMMLFGADFPGFLARFPPVAHLAYLPDMARLEQSLRESYHAADTDPVAPEVLADLPEVALLSARLTLAPALRLIRSSWPIHAIWLANVKGGPQVRAEAQDVVILRPDFDPEPHLLPKGGGPFLAALLAGDTLTGAIAAAGTDFDLSSALTLLLNGRALTGVA